MKKITLYECFHAKVKGERIYCEEGLILSPTSVDGSLEIKRLARGEPLRIRICQGCRYFDRMGPPLSPEERGWLNGTGAHVK
jgi:hypothetical protein